MFSFKKIHGDLNVLGSILSNRNIQDEKRKNFNKDILQVGFEEWV